MTNLIYPSKLCTYSVYDIVLNSSTVHACSKHERIDVSNNKAYVAAHNQPTSIDEVHYVDVHL